MIQSIKNYLFLPKTVSEFEDGYLARMNHVAMVFFLLHVPLFFLVGFFNGTGALMAMTLTSLTIAGPYFAMRTLESRRAVSVVMGITAMLMGGLLVHFGQGPVQIEMHFYFFVLIALLAVFANPLVVVAAAVTAAAHHAILWLILPTSIFNYDAPFWVVAVHATFVVLESVAACFIARSFFDNVIGLEKKVAERTEQVRKQSQDMRRVLDSVKQGFFTIDETAVISEERSAAVEDLFGAIEPGETFTNVLQRYDKKLAGWFEMGLADVFEDIMPIELTLDQLPSRIVADKRTLSIQYNAVNQGETLTGIAVVVSDITAEVEREVLEEDSREMMAMIDGVAKDRSGFLEFFQEASEIMRQLKDDSREDTVLVKRRVHTLKGNSSIFGLTRVARACHVIEDHIAETNEMPADAEWTRMFGCWARVRGNMRKLVADNAGTLTLSDQEYSELLQCILNHESTDSLATRVASWKLESTSSRLERISAQAKRLALELGKGNIHVKSRSNGCRIEATNWTNFWSSLVHVVRNAIDHGLESSEDRLMHGKSEVGTITLTTKLQGDEFLVVVSDDGAGIQWDKVQEMACKHGLPHQDHEDLVSALFYDGLSTASEVTNVSGRGVGMAALKEAVEDMDGRIEIESKVGSGTKFSFAFPARSMAPETVALLADYDVDDTGLVIDSTNSTKQKMDA